MSSDKTYGVLSTGKNFVESYSNVLQIILFFIPILDKKLQAKKN